MAVLDYAGDIRLFFDEAGEPYLLVEQNDLARDTGLETAFFISLFTDRRAAETETEVQQFLGKFPDLRGWWGDQFPEVDGDQIGSLLWLLERAKVTPQELIRVEGFIKASLAWAVEDGLCDSIEGTAERAGKEEIVITAIGKRPDSSQDIRFRWFYNWETQKIRGDSDAI
jgi:phage gp46-like protein